MTAALTGLELRSRMEGGRLYVSLESVTPGQPGPGELLVRVEAAPVNPSDLGLLLGPVAMDTLRSEGEGVARILTGEVPQAGVVAARAGQSLPVGNEGAGTVIAAGPDQQEMIGRTVAMIGGAMYAQYRLIAAKDCLLLPEGASARDGAALFVNPLTALGFVETMRAGGHSAIVHTAAASNLGQMLARICKADGVPLVNIVRSAAQVELLRGQGAEHVLDSTAPDFLERLEEAIAETGATIGFDAIGGGAMAGQILGAMEVVAARGLKDYSRYGSGARTQVYIYGILDTGPTILTRPGFSWNLGGWLLFPFLQQAGPEVAARMRARVVEEYATTFASHYSAIVSLADMLRPEIAAACAAKTTGEKYLIDPTLA